MAHTKACHLFFVLKESLCNKIFRRFEEASKREDDAAVERLFKLFPQIGRAGEGVDLYAKYLASQVCILLCKILSYCETVTLPLYASDSRPFLCAVNCDAKF